MHDEYLHALISKVESDDRIIAAWLEGSFGRGNADRYSDLDIHLLLAQAHVDEFRAKTAVWLSTLTPLVLFNWLFDGMLANALADNGLRIDLVLHADDTITLTPDKARVLVDKGDRIHFDQNTSSTNPAPSADTLEQQTKEFWRCIALLPSVVGRNELITGFMGLTVEVNLLVDILLAGYGIARDRGVKNLNQFLPSDLRQALQAALFMDGLSAASLAQAHLHLAKVMQQHGPIIAAKHEYVYPANLETTVLRYVQQELALLGLNTR